MPFATASNASIRRPIFLLARCAFACIPLCAASLCHADIQENQVLVVYNSVATNATLLKDYYLAAHPGIPAANVLNLNNSLLNTIELTYAQFVTLMRNPIRNYLLQAGAPDPQDIAAICLIRSLPHRIQDTDLPFVGDDPNANANEFTAGDATCASLDAELVLLWQNLDAGEAGGMMDSKSDNCIVNPYHALNDGIDLFSRANITAPKTFLNASNFCWLLGGSGPPELTPGDMYLVCRVEGNSFADAKLEIDRARDLYVNRSVIKVLLDEHNTSTGVHYDDDGLFSDDPSDPFWGGNDYELTRDTLLSDGWNVRYDDTFNFVDCTEETAPLIGYASYGENHGPSSLGEGPPGDGTFIDCFNFPPGAIFNTIESYNARALNNIGTLFSQEQVADFIAAGGTFGVGNVYEPFSFSVPDNAFLMPNMMLHGLTFAEAAYTSMPALSWQQLAVGDPLGKMTVIDDPGLPKGDMNGDGNVNGLDISWFVDVLVHGPSRYRTTFPTLDPVARGDFTGEYNLAVTDLPGFVNALLTAP